MQWKKVMSGVLAGAFILTSVTPAAASVEDIPVIEAQETTEDSSEAQITSVEEEESEVQEETVVSEEPETSEESVGAVSEEGLVASYDFEGDDPLQNKAGDANDAAVPVLGEKQNLAEYTEAVTYGEGRESGSQAIQLDGYGLKLNKKNLGKNFTISAWVKPAKQLAENQNVLFLGHHDPQKWLGIAGTKEAAWKIWANGNGYSWNTLFSPTTEVDQWYCLTIIGTEESVTAYVNGEKLGSKTTNDPLSGADQDIYLGVTYWDTPFSGLIDDVKVYNRTLTDTEAYQLYDDKTAAEILDEKGITATESLNIVKGHTKNIQVNMHMVIEEANPTITYTTSDETVVTVDENGMVTGVGAGQATITTTVRIDGVTKTSDTTVTVVDSQEGSLVASYNFEDNLNNEKQSGDAASAIVTGLDSYNGTVQYADGHTGKAVKLGNYGLKLNKQNLGTDYTVSVWLKPDGTIAENQAIVFMGHHDPERWFGVAGENGTNQCKIWTRYAGGAIYDGWVTLFSQTIGSDRWHNLTFTGTKGQVTAYLDGINLGTKESIDPLSGENQDIYLGVNKWDREFSGLIDDVKVYKDALAEEDVQKEYKAEYEEILAGKLQKAVTMDNILGKNMAAADVKYNLVLPSELNGLPVSWSSSDACVAADGTVKNESADKAVTLTATVTAGTLTATAAYEVTVKALDKTELEQLIAKAEKVDTTYATDSSKSILADAISEAKAADSYTEIDKATKRINKAISGLNYKQEYVNPFDSITAPATRKYMKVDETAELLVIPENVKDMVTVEYKSSDENAATYAESTTSSADKTVAATALKEGKVTVTAIVTAKYNGWKMEYSTALNVTKDLQPTDTPNPPTPTDTPNPPTPTDTPNPTNPSVTVTPPVESKGDGNVSVKVPDVAEGTKDVTVNLPDESLSEIVKSDNSDQVDLTVSVPSSISGNSEVTLNGIILPEEVLRSLKEGGKDLTVQVVGEGQKPYSWSISGKDVDKVRLSDVNLVLDMENAKKDTDVKDKLYADESGMSVDFKQKEGLPGVFTVTVNGSEYGISEGDEITLREYNEETGVMESTTQNCVAGSDGTVSFKVSSGMKYVLTKTTPIEVEKVDAAKTVATYSAIKLNWDKVEGADGYRVYRYDPKTKKYQKIAEVEKNTYTDKGRTKATGYIYKVRAYVKESKTYFGDATKAIKVLSDPLAPTNVKAKRVTKVSTKTTAAISFKKAVRANEYRIYKYNAKKDKYTIAYRVKNNKLYQYNSKTKKYNKVSNVTVKNGMMTCTLKNLNLKKEKRQKFKVRAVVTKKGYATGASKQSNAVTVK